MNPKLTRAEQIRLRRRAAWIVACGCMAAPGLFAADADKSKELAEEAPDYRNWTELTIGGAFVDGNEAAFQKRHRLKDGAYGGVQSFHFEEDLGKKGIFKVDGHGILDLHDYGLKIELTDPDFGYLKFGVSEFRNWYDGTGGYFPRNGQLIQAYDDNLFLDRSEIFVEAGLTLKDLPQFHFKYTRLTREGLKDSLVWGDSNLTGITPPASTARGITPSFWDIDETRNIFQGDLTHTISKTDLGLGIRYELSEINNSRNIRRAAGEAADRYLTHRDGVDSDLFNAHAFTETRFNDQWWLTTGYSFTTMDTDLTGSRIFGASYDPVYDPTFARRQTRDEGYFNLEGGSTLKQYVVNLNLMWQPTEHISVVPSIRVERMDVDSATQFVETNVGNAPARTSTQEELAALSDRGLLDVSEALEIRYTGITNTVLYARGNFTQGQGDQSEREIVVATGASDILRDTDFDRSMQKYTVGANWYPLRRLHFAVQYYHKTVGDDYTHVQDNTPNRAGNRYPAFLVGQDFDVDDVNFRVTFRPATSLTFVSRYDLQLSTVDMQGDGLDAAQASERTSHIFSQSVSWTPLQWLSLQGAISYVIDRTDTPADELTGAATGLVAQVDNDYWNANGTATLMLDNKTDFTAGYFYYKADNFVDNSAFSMAYGADAEEHGVTASVSRRIRKNIRLTCKYGFVRNREDTYGGFNDYDAHILASTLQYRF